MNEGIGVLFRGRAVEKNPPGYVFWFYQKESDIPSSEELLQLEAEEVKKYPGIVFDSAMKVSMELIRNRGCAEERILTIVDGILGFGPINPLR